MPFSRGKTVRFALAWFTGIVFTGLLLSLCPAQEKIRTIEGHKFTWSSGTVAAKDTLGLEIRVGIWRQSLGETLIPWPTAFLQRVPPADTVGPSGNAVWVLVNLNHLIQAFSTGERAEPLLARLRRLVIVRVSVRNRGKRSALLKLSQIRGLGPNCQKLLIPIPADSILFEIGNWYGTGWGTGVRKYSFLKHKTVIQLEKDSFISRAFFFRQEKGERSLSGIVLPIKFIGTPEWNHLKICWNR